MIELHQYPAIWNLPSLSPFCIKVELFLKASHLPYRTITELNPRRGPKGKMPFIVDRGRVIADSSFIITHLIDEYGLDGYSNCPPEDIAHAHAFQKLIEEHLYFILLYARWLEPESWAITKREFSKLFPPLVGSPFLGLIRSNLKKQALAQGLARHSRDEIYSLARQDLRAISTFLGEKRFFLGNRWTPVDASLSAFLMTILRQPVGKDLKALVYEFENLISYDLRLTEQN